MQNKAALCDPDGLRSRRVPAPNRNTRVEPQEPCDPPRIPEPAAASGLSSLLPPRSLALLSRRACSPPAPDFCPSPESLHLWFRLALLGTPQRRPRAGLGQEGRGCVMLGTLGSPAGARGPGRERCWCLGDIPLGDGWMEMCGERAPDPAPGPGQRQRGLQPPPPSLQSRPSPSR